MNISHFCFILFNLKIFGEMVIPNNLQLSKNALSDVGTTE